MSTSSKEKFKKKELAIGRVDPDIDDNNEIFVLDQCGDEDLIRPRTLDLRVAIKNKFVLGIKIDVRHNPGNKTVRMNGVSWIVGLKKQTVKLDLNHPRYKHWHPISKRLKRKEIIHSEKGFEAISEDIKMTFHNHSQLVAGALLSYAIFFSDNLTQFICEDGSRMPKDTPELIQGSLMEQLRDTKHRYLLKQLRPVKQLEKI